MHQNVSQKKQQDTSPEEFELPFGGKLVADNRWVVLAKIIPWTDKACILMDIKLWIGFNRASENQVGVAEKVFP